MQQFLLDTLANIKPLNIDLLNTAQAHLDNLTKPQGSLGRLEDIAKHIFLIKQGHTPLKVDPFCMFTVAADHGIVEDGIAAFPQEVTRQMVLNFLNGGAGINVLCRQANIDLFVVDAGCVGGAFDAHHLLIDKRLGEGTFNFAKKAAMSRETCLNALKNGIDLATQAANKGYASIGIGEMGIGNTTSATALFCAMLNLTPENVVGPGAGASPEMLRHKQKVIENALTLHADALKAGDAVDILSILGGFEIATMAGIILGAAAAGCVVMVDGFIATAAYVAAISIFPMVEDYVILAHSSAEPGYAHVLQYLEQDDYPLLNLGLRLGEGTGVALAVPIVRSATAIYNEMATFDQAKITT